MTGRGRGFTSAQRQYPTGLIRSTQPVRDVGDGGRPTYGGGRAGTLAAPYGQAGPGRIEPGACHSMIRTAYKDKGTDGQRVELVGNFYQILLKSITFYHYDLKITFQKQITNIKKLSVDDPTMELSSANANEQKFIQRFANDIFKKFVDQNRRYFPKEVSLVFDGFKNVYTMAMIDMGGASSLRGDVELAIEGRKRDFSVKLQLTDTIDSSVVDKYYNNKMDVEIEQKVITAYEIFFKHLMDEQYEQFQRKFFDIDTAGGGQAGKLVEYVSGFQNSIRPTEFGLAMNIHLKTTCTVSREVRSVCDLVRVVLNLRGIDLSQFQFQPRHIADVNRIARHLKVITDYRGEQKSTFTIDSIVNQTAYQFTFKRRDPRTKEEEMISIADYFQKEYGITLKNLPLVKTGAGRKTSHLPMELCKMPMCQFLNSNKLGPDIQSQLLTRSTHTPDVYFDKLNKLVRKVTKMDPQLYDAFKIKLTEKPVALTGRVLAPPVLKPDRPRAPFYNPISGAQMLMFGLDPNVSEKVLNDFYHDMLRSATEYGFGTFHISLVKSTNIQSLKDIKNIVANIKKNCPDVSLVFFGIPRVHQTLTGSMIYAYIKHLCDQKAGIVTQCFKLDNAVHTPRGYMDNILLKINGKLGGQNNVIDTNFLQKLPINHAKTMMLGVDVNHPGDLEHTHSSIASVVATMDPMFSQFVVNMRVQKQDCDEIITELDVMMEELLYEYAERNHHYPENIIVFRDGVSEGQFKKLVDIEIPQVCRMLEKVNKDSKVTWLVIQKRHHGRFVLQYPNSSGRRATFNVPSGTVVDQLIVEPTFPMFYLNSHFSQLGTSRPTKYIVLLDQAHLKINDLQRICFYTCFNCVRTRQPIALPLSVRYADLSAYRSKLHIEVQRKEVYSSTNVYDSPAVAEAKMIQTLNQIIRIDPKVKDRLYYA